ncbi:MAG: MYG1 family protein [bacterium]|nr:MYG1 family protein [bacterium]
MSVKKLVTHNGTFHADDLFACAVLALVMDNENAKYEIIRTRDMEVITNADYVFDVGGIYDADTNRYDHHQKGGAGIRSNNIPYASFGLVWKHFGLKLCNADEEAWQLIDIEIASPIDANDNGIDIGELKFENVRPYVGSRVFTIHEPTWKEENEINIDKIFTEQVTMVKQLLRREIKVALDDTEAKKIIQDAYEKTEDKRIIFLENSFPRYLYQQVLSSLPEPIYLIYKSAHGESYKVEAVSQSPQTMQSRKPFPDSWRGFLNNDSKATDVIGIDGILFVHSSGFLANLNNKENAIKFAKKALIM